LTIEGLKIDKGENPSSVAASIEGLDIFLLRISAEGLIEYAKSAFINN
jgi:hypothetical protein